MGYNKAIVTSTAGGVEAYNLITAQLSARGWTNASGTWTSPDSTLAIQFNGTTPGGYETNGIMRLACMGTNFELFTGGSNTSWVGVEVSVSADHVWISLTGPGASQTGAADATGGSATSVFLATRIVPYFSTDTTVANRWAVVGHPVQGTAWSGTRYLSWSFSTILVRDAVTGTVKTAELSTLKPTLDDVAAVGEQPPSYRYGAGSQAAPYVIVESIDGFRGRLENVFWVTDRRLLSPGDGTIVLPTFADAWIGGDRYVAPQFPFCPSTVAANVGYTAFGVAGQNGVSGNGVNASTFVSAGGPIMVVKRGTGA